MLSKTILLPDRVPKNRQSDNRLDIVPESSAPAYLMRSASREEQTETQRVSIASHLSRLSIEDTAQPHLVPSRESGHLGALA